MTTIRIAGPEDFVEVWRLLYIALEEGAIFALADDKARWLINRALSPETIHPTDTRSRGVIGVIGPVGKLEGVAFLCLSSQWYSDELYIEELAVVVDPEHRKTNHAQILIDWMKQQSDEVGLPLVAGVVSNDRTEGKCRFYRRKLPKAGEFFLLMPKQGNMMPALSVASS